MISIILAGGRGTRMCQNEVFLNTEKPLLKIGGVKMLDLVVDAVKKSIVNEFFVAVSPRTCETKKYCREKGYNIIETEGRGYHEDTAVLLKSYPVFVSLSCDTPFISSCAINNLVESYNGMSVTGCIALESIPQGVTPSYTFSHRDILYAAVGINIVAHSENSEIFVFDDPLLGINVNTLEELEVARDYFLDEKSGAPSSKIVPRFHSSSFPVK